MTWSTMSFRCGDS